MTIHANTEHALKGCAYATGAAACGTVSTASAVMQLVIPVLILIGIGYLCYYESAINPAFLEEIDLACAIGLMCLPIAIVSLFLASKSSCQAAQRYSDQASLHFAQLN